MKRWILAALVAMATVPALGCVDRVVGYDEEPSYPACATITALGHWDSGAQYVIFNEQTGTAGTGCLCLTEQEIQSGERDDEINDVAFAECTRLADVYSGDFDWDDCEANYLSGEWIASIAFAEGETAWKAPDDLDCSGDDSPEGCSVLDERGLGASYCSVLLGLLWLRRRHARRRFG